MLLLRLWLMRLHAWRLVLRPRRQTLQQSAIDDFTRLITIVLLLQPTLHVRIGIPAPRILPLIGR